MKYIKFLFNISIIALIFFMSKTNIYAIENDEDLTLSRIYVEPGTLEPEFSEVREYYTLVLNPDVSNLIVQATPTNTNLKYEIKGNENLNEGENIITITVFSEDNTRSKIYTINALKTNNKEEYNALLSTLIVDNYPFKEEFFPEKFNYTLKDEVRENSLEIFAYPQNENATIKIEGNENLNNSEYITVTVTSANKLANRIYTISKNITPIQSIDNVDNLENTNESNFQKYDNKSSFKTFIITTIIIITILVIIIFTFKKKNI